MAENETISERIGYMVEEKSVLFYMDCGLVASAKHVRIQWAFDVLI